MNQRSESLQYTLSAAQWAEIDRLCDRYEADWSPQRSDDLAVWARQIAVDLRAAAAEELIALDRQLRAAAGCSAELPSYAEALHVAVPPSQHAAEVTERPAVGSACTFPNNARDLTAAATSPARPTNASAADDSTRSTNRSLGHVPAHFRLRDPTAEIPVQIGRYRITAYLSSGGQGDVFRAIHPTLNREVVIKWGRCCLGDGVPEVQALLREGRILAQLDHPNLVRVYDLDFYEGCPFLVLDFIAGRSLRQRRAAGDVAAVQAAKWTAQAARALAEVHRQGLVHLDIKPENVLIDDSDQARVVDFGLALLPELWAEPQAPLGCFRGTPAFASPEQARGATQWADARADVFGLGALLYWLLTSRAPYQGDTMDEVLALAAQCRFNRNALRGVPRPLAEITLRAMSARPEERYPSADALADELETWVSRQTAGSGTRRLLQAAAVLAPIALVLIALAASPLGQQVWRRWPAASAIELAPSAANDHAHQQPSRRDGDSHQRPDEQGVQRPTEPAASSVDAASSTDTPSADKGSASESAPGQTALVENRGAAAEPENPPPPGTAPLSSASPAEDPSPLRWDRRAGILFLNDTVIRRVRVSQGGNIVKILDAFASQRWPRWVDRPLGDEADRKTLFAACSSLNESLDRIRFRVAGNGVEWFFADRPVPK